jgi:hypothetical protein
MYFITLASAQKKYGQHWSKAQLNIVLFPYFFSLPYFFLFRVVIFCHFAMSHVAHVVDSNPPACAVDERVHDLNHEESVFDDAELEREPERIVWRTIQHQMQHQMQQTEQTQTNQLHMLAQIHDKVQSTVAELEAAKSDVGRLTLELDRANQETARLAREITQIETQAKADVAQAKAECAQAKAECLTASATSDLARKRLTSATNACNTLIEAVQKGQKNGAYTLEEAATIFNVIKRLQGELS